MSSDALTREREQSRQREQRYSDAVPGWMMCNSIKSNKPMATALQLIAKAQGTRGGVADLAHHAGNRARAFARKLGHEKFRNFGENVEVEPRIAEIDRQIPRPAAPGKFQPGRTAGER